MIVLGWAWRLAVNVVQLIVVLAVFANLRGRFEIIVVSILGFIYIAVRVGAFSNGLLHVNLAKAFDHKMLHLRDLLGDPPADWEVKETADTIKSIDRQLKKAYVDMAF